MRSDMIQDFNRFQIVEQRIKAVQKLYDIMGQYTETKVNGEA